MKALTIRQPWAQLVAIGEKQIETRSWRPKYRGPLMIHAAVGMTRLQKELAEREPFVSVLKGIDLPRGFVVATADLVDVLTTEDLVRGDLTEQEFEFGDYRPGRFGWVLHDVQVLRAPVQVPGALSLWTPPENEIAAVLEQIGVPA